MNEILTIDFDVKTWKVKKWLDTLRDDISWFQKRVESDEWITLSLNKSRIQQDLQDVTRLIKVANDKGDFNAEISLRADQNLLKQQLTQANRELTNFLRTGEKDVSVLGKLFWSLENKIEWVEMELIKMGRSEKEVAHLRNRMNELNDSFKSWTINAQQMAMEMNKLENEMNNIKNAPQGFQEKMGVAYGKVMGYIALITTAIYGLKWAFDEALEWERIDIQLSNRLRWVWSNVWKTKDQIKDLSSALSEMTTIDEDAITQMQSRLLNFQTIQWDTFDRASKVVLDYATAMNDGVTPSMEDLSSSADKLWTILNNPEKWFNKLIKAWIVFSDEEEKLFKRMQDSNDEIWMQEILLKKLEWQYSWSAETIKDTTQGMLNSIANTWNNILETIWNVLLKIPFIAWKVFDLVAWWLVTLALWFWEGFLYIWKVVVSVWSQLIDNWGKIWDWMLQVGNNSIDNFWIIGSNIYETLSSWFSKIPAKFKEYWNKIVDFLPQTVKDTLWVEWFTIDTTSVTAKIKSLKPLVWDAFKGVDIKIPPADFSYTQKSIWMLWDTWKQLWNIITATWDKWKKIWSWIIWDYTGDNWSSKGSWKSARDKQLEAEKKRLEEVKKKEEELGKARTTAYEKAIKSSDAFKSAVDEANKKLDEQKRKMDEIKAKATETLLDIEEKMSWEKTGLQDKLAQRYIKIFDELRSSLGWADGVFAWATNSELESALFGWQIAWTSFDWFKKEIELIKSTLSSDELSLAVTKEKRSETEKITAEYQKQLDLNQREKDVADAKLNNRFLTNAKTGEIQFLDKNGEVIQWGNRSQAKDFASQAKEIQDIADESIKIEQEKMTKISAIVKDYEDERARLRNNYYTEDKNLKIAQENMAQAFFKEELARMTTMKNEAINLTNALISLKNAGGSAQNITNVNTTNNNQQSTQVVQVKTVTDIQQVNKTLGIGITLKK